MEEKRKWGEERKRMAKAIENYEEIYEKERAKYINAISNARVREDGGKNARERAELEGKIRKLQMEVDELREENGKVVRVRERVEKRWGE